MSWEAVLGAAAIIVAAIVGQLVRHTLKKRDERRLTRNRSEADIRGDAAVQIGGGVRTEPQPEWVHVINKLFPTKVKIIGLVDQEPELIDDGMLKLTSSQRQIAQEQRDRLSMDTLHAVLVGQPFAEFYSPYWHIKKLLYSEVCALRAEGEKPSLLSANAVLFCNERREIYLQKRSENMATYPSSLHTFGGTFWAPGSGWRAPDDGMSLVTTAEREVREESNLRFKWEGGKLLVAEEIDTGFVQLLLVGVALGTREVERRRPNWEGDVVMIPFDQISRFLLSDSIDWVPTGKAHLLSWLAMGAPGSSTSAWSAIGSPEDIFLGATTENRSDSPRDSPA